MEEINENISEECKKGIILGRNYAVNEICNWFDENMMDVIYFTKVGKKFNKRTLISKLKEIV